jgi:hypothetical protein
MPYEGVRNKTYTTGTGKPVHETQQLDGEAKDSLSGTNVTKEYTTGEATKGKLGGMPSHE